MCKRPVHTMCIGATILSHRRRGRGSSAMRGRGRAAPPPGRLGPIPAVGEGTVILLHPPLPAVGVSIVMGRRCQQHGSRVNEFCHSAAPPSLPLGDAPIVMERESVSTMTISPVATERESVSTMTGHSSAATERDRASAQRQNTRLWPPGPMNG